MTGEFHDFGAGAGSLGMSDRKRLRIRDDGGVTSSRAVGRPGSEPTATGSIRHARAQHKTTTPFPYSIGRPPVTGMTAPVM